MHRIISYEITVEVISSVLPPTCHAQAILVVKDNTLVDVRKIRTPEANHLPDGKLMLNPQCEEYERYLVTSMFDLVDKLQHNKQPSGIHISAVKFNPEYGYVTYLRVFGGESVLEVTTTNFSALPAR